MLEWFCMAKHSSYIFAGLAVILWGSTAAVTKLLLGGLDSWQVLFFNCLFAFLGLLAVAVLQKKTVLVRGYTKKDFLVFAGMGFLGPFIYTLFLISALSRLPAQEAFIINYLWPVMTVIFAVFLLKEKTTGVKVLGTVVSFLGVVIVVTRGAIWDLQFSNSAGVLFAGAGAALFGLFSVLGKKQIHEKLTSMTIFYFFGALYSLISVILFSDIGRITLTQLAGVVWLGAFTSGLAFVFWFMAFQKGDTAKMSNLILLTPFVSLVYIYFLLGEKILPSSVLGLLVVVAGIAIQSSQKPV